MPPTSENPTGRKERIDPNAHRQPDAIAPTGLSPCTCSQGSQGREPVCLPRLAELHRAYLAGSLSVELMIKIDRHLIQCRRCENHWDALTSALEDGLLAAQASAEAEEDDDEVPCVDDHEMMPMLARVLPHES